MVDAECTAVGVAHPKCDERSILLCQLKPDDVPFVDEIPLGPTGKTDKKAIRAGLEGYKLPFEVTR